MEVDARKHLRVFKIACTKLRRRMNLPLSVNYAKLQKCMEAHSDYYGPFLEAQQTDAQLFMKELMSSVENEEEKEEKYIAFMRGGGCKEPYMAWHNCIEEAEKNKEHSVTCLELGSKITKCIEAHSDYYHPILAATKTVEEQFMKDIQAFLSEKR